MTLCWGRRAYKDVLGECARPSFVFGVSHANPKARRCAHIHGACGEVLGRLDTRTKSLTRIMLLSVLARLDNTWLRLQSGQTVLNGISRAKYLLQFIRTNLADDAF